MSNTDGKFQRYLAAKRTVDDRALDRQVLDRLATEVERIDEKRGERPLRVLDVGAGIGATLKRLVERDVLPAAVEYTLVDREATNIDAARERLPQWVTDAGYEAAEIDDGLRIEGDEQWVDLEFAVADAFEYVETSTWDLLVGQAFLDLFDARRAFDALRAGLRPGGCWYFPITFDGGTILSPPVDPDLDTRIERAFHAHIDDGGDSHAGRHLLARASKTDTVLAAGGSDWVVHPRSGEYPDDETFFLRYIVDTIAGALDETGRFDPTTLAGWTAARHRQIDRGELTYVAHQLDVLGRIPAER
ncbi:MULTISPECIES: class I SAM-dependent methyltransferase [Halococcus]|uniref:Methyltransferase family protein n=1 Tax=Halococcus salifodinae DSM 8989 TaxID=1227456 RepID=M0N9L5_9EURY|nr:MULTISPECIES: class I SAM-dependent methyltransferase [Halococcus]EMA53345.1 methyltransferase family protein [Halococcus salifodinae DSM 8989]